ncbi:MAG: zinc ribbon domain-containing protein [Polyangiales bacterium]
MAFCPHCGKQVTEQATKCIACGGELEPKAKAARFKGTMMMAPATREAAAPTAQPAPAPAEAPAPAPPLEALKAAAPTPAAPPKGPSKVMKHTMLGTGGAGLPPPARAAASMPQAAPPAAGAASRAAMDPALAETSRAPGFNAPVAPIARPAPAPQPEAPSPSPPDDKPQREDSQRFLTGDPMAAKPAAARVPRRDETDETEAPVPKQRTGTMIAIAVVGMLVIIAIGYLAASFIK